jgi:hypothetical protein
MSHGGGSAQIRRLQRRDRVTGWIVPGAFVVFVVAFWWVGR